MGKASVCVNLVWIVTLVRSVNKMCANAIVLDATLLIESILSLTSAVSSAMHGEIIINCIAYSIKINGILYHNILDFVIMYVLRL